MAADPSARGGDPGGDPGGDQVAAHRFARRRAASALVRADAAPTTDPLRTQSRATLVGLLLALLGLGGAAVVGLVDRPVDWHAASIVTGSGSGALYVVARGPDRLVPVPNVASARLVAAALAEADPTGSAPGGSGLPAEVDDAVLETAPRSRPVGIVDAPALPSPTAAVPPVWSVCDTARPDPASPRPLAQPRVTTGVVAAGTAPGRPLAAGEALLLRERSGATWLVHDRVRARIDPADAAVVTALGLGGRTPRPATASLLAAIPEGPPIVAPAVPGRGAPGPPGLAGEPVGGVVRLVGPGLPDRYLVVEAAGVQEVPPLVARLVRLSDPARATTPIPVVSPGQVAAVPGARGIPLEDYPAAAPVPVPLADAPSTCAAATGTTAGTTLTVAGPEPAAGPTGTGTPTPLPGADGSGDRVDTVALPGAGVVVRGVPPGRPDAPGPTLVVAATGPVSTVPDAGTAAVLGLGPPAPVPDAVLALLPAGPALTVTAAVTPVR